MREVQGDLTVVAIIVLVLLAVAVFFPAQARGDDWTFGIQTGGAVYFDAEPGPLEITVWKRDQVARRDWNQTMRLTLVSPDRQIVAEAVIPDFPSERMDRSREWSDAQSVTLSVDVPMKGVYMMLVTIDNDSYGRGILWTFTTNAQRYVIDSGMGHVDGTRNEEIVLALPEVPGDVCFQPTRAVTRIQLTGMPQSVSQVIVSDSNGRETRLPVAGGNTNHVVVAGSHTLDRTWCLHLPAQQVRASIEGVTHWNDESMVRLPLWSPGRDTYFDLLPYRWLVTPYHVTEYVESGSTGNVEFTLFNNGPKSIDVSLSLLTQLCAEPVGEAQVQVGGVEATLSTSSVTLAPQTEATVTVAYQVSGDDTSQQVHLLAVVDEGAYQTYSTLIFEPQAKERVTYKELQLRPFLSQRDLFGYAPTYPVGTEPYFDPDNVPWLIAEGQLWRRDPDIGWARVAGLFETLAAQHGPGDWSLPSSRIGFDASGAAYVVARKGQQGVLVRVAGNGSQIQTAEIPGDSRGHVILETFSGHNDQAQPPAILRYTSLGLPPRDPNNKWGVDHRLELIIPRIEGGELVVAEPIVISEHCIGMADHTGLTSPVTSKDGKVHLIWGETSDPAARHTGVPTFEATCDLNAGTLRDQTLVGYAPPANDVHNVPSLVIDSQGYLHAILGAHNQTFQYARSLKPHDTSSGWTSVEKVAAGYEQTYVGVVVTEDDTLHLVSRIWRPGAYFPGLFDAALFHQTKRPGEPWSKPRQFLLPALPHYSIYYNRLTIDRRGRLYLSYDYWPTWTAYRAELRSLAPAGIGMGRALLASDDGGIHWYVVEDDDFR